MKTENITSVPVLFLTFFSSRPNKILRLKGKGLPSVNGYSKGDILVKVNVWIPKSLGIVKQ